VLFAAKKGYKEIIDNKGRFVLAHAASGHKRSLQTVFADVSVLARLNDTRAASEVWALNSFFKALATNSSKAYYGYRHVRLAADRHAVDVLLVSDALFRVRDATIRRDYVQLVDDVTASGGNVRVFSSMHVTGEQLTQMSGIAALLRFAIEDMDDASVIYSTAAARHAKASGIAGEGADVKDGPEHEGQSTYEVEYDSDGSSDSDASYKVAAGAGVA
jgi:protein pelota